MKSMNQLLATTLVAAGLCSLTPKLHAVMVYPVLPGLTATASAVEGGTAIAVTYSQPVDGFAATDPFNYAIGPAFSNNILGVTQNTPTMYSLTTGNPLNSATDVFLQISGLFSPGIIIGPPIDVTSFGEANVVTSLDEVIIASITYRTPESGSTLAMLSLVGAGLIGVRRRKA